jgi:anti-sigma B factor antagonist
MSWRDAPGAPPLEIRDAPLAGAPGLAVAGELDVATAPQLRAALEAAIRDSRGAYVIDLADVGLIDSAGIATLLRGRALLGREERDALIVCPSGSVLHLLEASGVTEQFAVFASRGAAARRLVPPN